MARHASDRAQQLYADMLAEVALRLDAAEEALRLSSWPAVRLAAVEVRGVLEMLVFSGLLTHQGLFDRVDSALAQFNRKAALRLVRSVNHDWWPRPVCCYPDRIEDRRGDDWLAEDRWDAAYTQSSMVLHTRNPFVATPMPTPQSHHEKLAELHLRLVNLLTAHWIAVEPSSRFGLLAKIGPQSQTPRVRVNAWESLE